MIGNARRAESHQSNSIRSIGKTAAKEAKCTRSATPAAKRRIIADAYKSNMDDGAKQNKIDELDKIYQDYYKNLLDLRKQQDKIVSNFIEALKQESIKELRKKFETQHE